jgi:tripartite-type tricarboxylate transporter receptor subunit TctC
MKLPRRQFLHLAAGAAALAPLSRLAWAQTYPAQPVRVIVPFAPGGQVDVVGRLLAQKLSEQLGRQFYVENVAGAGGSIGTARAAQAAPDGYTILVPDGIAFTANPSLNSKAAYDPIKDFVPIAVAATTMQVLAVHPSVPAHTVQELVALIKAAPGKYSYASAGVGSGAHLTGELFRRSLGLDIVHVPYNSGAQVIAAAIAGHTPISFGSPAATIPHIKDGKMRALAACGKARVRQLPDVPTMREAGYPEVECDTWLGALAPAKTSSDIIALLHRDIVSAVALPDVQNHLVTLGFEPARATPEEFATLIKTDIAKWADVIRAAGLKSE